MSRTKFLIYVLIYLANKSYINSDDVICNSQG